MQAASSEAQSAAIPVRSRHKAMDWSLVLASQGIPTTISHSDETGWALLVDPPDMERAVKTIRQYHVENRLWEWRQQLPWSQLAFHWGAVPACLLLVIIHQLSAETRSLYPAWAFDTAAVRTGQWWRLFTAILLHSDLAHLLANVTTGVLLLGLAMARFGAGCGLLAAYLAGALGNLAGLLLYGRPYTGLGASGMVMGALGLLTFHSAAFWRSNPNTSRDLMRGGVAGVLLFLILGVDPDSDVIAHLGGFLGGGFLGVLLSFLPARTLENRIFSCVNWIVLIGLLALTASLGVWQRE
ncbi:MAG: rhomboid family intramembrane serine protease [Verrucomicrobiales bacterium]|nr:rhomboid family intramembrane serine protease [Verrucomicrobiales bacterium]